MITKKIQKLASGNTTLIFRNGTRKFSATFIGGEYGYKLVERKQFENEVETFATIAELQTAMRGIAPISKWMIEK